MTLRTEARTLARSTRLQWLPRRETTWRRASIRYVGVMSTTDFVVAMVVTSAMSHGHYGAADALALGLLAAVVLVVVTALNRGYRRENAAIGTQELRSIVRVAGILGVASLTIQGLGIVDLPHALVLQVLLATIALALLTRLVQRKIARHLRADGRLARRTLLIGPLPGLQPVLDSLDDAQVDGLRVVGICTPDQSRADGRGPIVGTYDAVPQTVMDLDVETVVVSADAMDAAELRRLGWTLRDLGVELLVLPPLVDVMPHRLRIETMAGTPLLAVSLTESRGQRLAKSLVDRTVGSALLILALPVIACAGMAVRLTSRGPAFFSQTRVGLNSQPFEIYKLRSMYIDAEARLAELHKRNDGNGMLFKMHDDPRVTRVGRTLRRLSIDELPQLWNVVRGNMSLVGPRPALPHEVAAYEGDVVHRLAVKPGLTGLWQVSGRSNLSAERSVGLDLRYTDNWTMGMDAHILLRTAHAVVSGDGAY
ncbi:sugar transferase [Georgenia sp. Marseille-Q6866]